MLLPQSFGIIKAVAFTAIAVSFLPNLGMASPTLQGSKSDPSAFVYPNIADISHATPDLVTSLRSYFTDKTNHDAAAWLSHFNTEKITYIDAVVGFSFNSSTFAPAIKAMTTQWGAGGKSYPLRIIGNTQSAVVFLRNTPELFGNELFGFAAIDFEHGKVVRQVDYWDGRRVPFVAHRVPDDQFPTDFGEESVTTKRHAVIDAVTKKLGSALNAGNSSAAAALFTPEAVFEDLTTRTRIQGQLAIQRYLNRTLSQLPYGTGATIRHNVGNELGGGYEWVGGASAISGRGINVLELNNEQLITRFTSIWDASRASDASIVELAALAVEI
jgi:hypothetical protein